jgi:hypothetical protein
METIQGYQGDESAGTRLAVWGWTWNYALDHPFGGGFEAYRQNKIQVRPSPAEAAGGDSPDRRPPRASPTRAAPITAPISRCSASRAFPACIMFLLIHGIGIVRMEVIRRRYRRTEGEAWIAPLATALQHFQIIYLVGALFVGIAYQPFVYLLLASQIGFDAWLSRRERATRKEGFSTMTASRASRASAGPLLAIFRRRRQSASPTATRSTG